MRLMCQRSVSALIAIVAFGCTSPTASVGLDATVHFVTSVESSCWSLVTPTKVYEPVDLPAAFRVEGLKVHVVKTYEQATYLLLDGMLGEYAVEAGVGFIEIVAAEGRRPGRWRPLTQVREAIRAAPPR